MAGATLTTLSIQETDAALLDLSVFLNPTSDLVNIRINHSSIEQVFVSITDLQGKEVYNGKYAGISNTIGINTSTYARGTLNFQTFFGHYQILAKNDLFLQK